MISLCEQTIQRARDCKLCEPQLPMGAKPIFHISDKAEFIIISQAPGRIAHLSGVPFHDNSGIRLREWLGINEEEFYNSGRFAILPMGFCYPGKAASGDLPPRKECAPAWHEKLLDCMPHSAVRLLIGQYAQKYYLPAKARKRNLTETVRCFEEYLPEVFPLPHPSPLNNIWLKRNAWFNEQTVPALQRLVRRA